MKNLCTLAVFVSASAALAEDARLADFARIRDVKQAVVSPDGQRLAYVLAVTDLPANRVQAQLWVAGLAGLSPQRLLGENDAVEQVLWSPRGHQLAVVATAKEPAAPHLWIVDVDSGASKQIARIERSNHYLAHHGADLCWSPDGTALAYLAVDAGARLPTDDPLVVSRIQYKTRTAFSDNRRTHIWVVDCATGKSRQLTKGIHDEHSIDWSASGDIVFCSNREQDPDANLNNDLYAVKVADGSIRQLTRTPGNEMTPAWSPDGRSLAYTMTKRPLTTIDSVAEDAHVWLLEREDGPASELTAALDRRCSNIAWHPDGKSVCFLVRDKGRGLIYRMPAAGGAAKPLFSMDGMVTRFSLPKERDRGVCVLSTATMPAEIFTFPITGGEPVQRTSFNEPVVRDWQPVQPRTLHCKSFDGTDIEGWLLLPAAATAKKKAPVLLFIHGGPHGMYGYQFSATFQLLCARGYAVLYLNPRGSTGYGQRFSDGTINDWGGGDYKDLMAGLDHALAEYPQLDGQRLGVTGGSYGGYMTNWVITQTPRFKAAVTYASLSNLISFYATSLYQDLVHVEFEGKPWDRFEILWERSPLRHIRKVTTPTLIQHGEADFDVHISQSEELYTALKVRGIETIFVRYPRQGHGATEPRQQLDLLERTAAWFDRFLK